MQMIDERYVGLDGALGSGTEVDSAGVEPATVLLLKVSERNRWGADLLWVKRLLTCPFAYGGPLSSELRVLNDFPVGEPFHRLREGGRRVRADTPTVESSSVGEPRNPVDTHTYTLW